MGAAAVRRWVGVRRTARLGLAVVLAAALIVGLAAGARAHALLKSSNPPAGSDLAKSPSQVVLTFTEPPDPALSSITLVSSAGETMREGAVEGVPGDPAELRIPITTPLPTGAYTVSWRTVSKIDGHVTAGSFSFGVGTAAPSGTVATSGAVSSAPPPSPLAVASRWLFFSGLALLVGAAAVGVVVVGRQVGRPWMLWAALGLSLVGLIGMIVAERSTVGISYGQLFRSGTGREFVARALGLVVLAIAVAVATLKPGRWSLALVGVVAAGVLLVHAVEGHAGAPSSVRLGNIAVDWLHLVAVGVWVGGLVWLFLAIRPAAHASVGWDARGTFVRRFSRLATVALVVVLLTGLLRAVAEVGSLRQLVSSSFGVALIVKAGLVVLLVGLGALNHFGRVPHADDPRSVGRVRHTVAGEIGVATAVLLVASILSQLPPASSVSEAAARSGPAPLVVTGHDFATTTRLRLTVSPGTVGSNLFTAQVTDYDTGAAIPATDVQLAFRLPSRPDVGTSTLDLAHVSGATWRAKGSPLSIFGTYAVEATVQEATSAVTVPLEIRPRLPQEQIAVNAAPGQPTISTVTLDGGGSLQTYVDPATSGPNTVHFTFFDASGSEMRIVSATASKVPPGGASQPMGLIRFDKGHFAANVTLRQGRWIFLITARTSDGKSVGGYFSAPVGAAGG
jgi:copper transport protein